MTEQELKEYYMIFTGVWKFFRKWVVMEFPMTDEQWSQAAEESEKLFDQYGRCKMAEYLILGAMQKLDELERQVRR